MSIAYVEHPCSKEEKKKHLKKFDKVIDARYAPKKLKDGDKLIMKPKTKDEKTKAEK